MLGGRETTGEQLLLVHEGASYDEVYLLGHGPEEGSSCRQRRNRLPILLMTKKILTKRE